MIMNQRVVYSINGTTSSSRLGGFVSLSVAYLGVECLIRNYFHTSLVLV